MASSDRRTSISLEKNLLPYKKDFFYLIWKMLENEKSSVEECIRFIVDPELSFCGNDMSEIKCVGSTYNVKINFTGIIGSQGTLPLYLREKLFRLPREKHRRYLILYACLQQRSLQIAYEAWLQRRIPLQAVKKNSLIKDWLNSITGSSSSHPWQINNKETYRYYFSAHFSNLHRPQNALQQILSTILEQPVKIISMQGAWIPLIPDQRTFLKKSAGTQLGLNTPCGEKVWSFQAGFQLQIGPISGESVQQYFSNNEKLTLIKKLLLHYVNHYYFVRLQILVENSSIHPCCLSVNSWNQLGQFCFLGNLKKSGVNSNISFKLKTYD